MQGILRLPAVMQKLGRAESTVYSDIKEGLLPKPVRIGPRAVGWPEAEIDAIISARIAGKTDEQVCGLVKELTAARTAYSQPVAA